jgi:hypothetical protein
MGMQTVFAFGDEADIRAQSGPVDEGYLTYGGSVEVLYKWVMSGIPIRRTTVCQIALINRT